MAQQVAVDPAAIAGEEQDDSTVEVARDVAYKRLAIVNVAFVGAPDAAGWVLVDAGIAGTAGAIRRAAERRFGPAARPAAIVMTHGHFDHVGALRELAAHWDVPVYAHAAERPYLDGSTPYPPPDPSVGGGLMARLAPLYPRGPFDVADRLATLPADGSIPVLPGWRWVHTPGHAPGHVSLWRQSDGTLIAGDAFITTAQESAYAVATQAPELHGPPRYYTPDWAAAGASVRTLSALAPERVVTGHGRAMQGEAMRAALAELAARFDEVAVPEHGRYVADPGFRAP